MFYVFQDLDQAQIMGRLSSQNDEWAQLYPSISQLAAIALTVPISSVNCERDFSTMNRVRNTALEDTNDFFFFLNECVLNNYCFYL